MHPIQLSALLSTVLLPLALFAAHRWFRSAAFEMWARRFLAIALVVLEVANVGAKFAVDAATLDEALPMHLCDWSLAAIAIGLWFRSQAGFELAYFWALAGTFQALLTPAIEFSAPAWRLCGFFYSHALIVVGVLHMLLVERMRPWPRSLLRLLLWSGVYLAAALITNTLTGGNYGFLAHRPAQATLLDHFSDTRWLYVAQINLVALVFFAALYLPWLVRDLARRKRGESAL
jgi:hypothetical integral membrane protein (TIGR02206 family)